MNNYIALYRKWRPRTFADVIGQEHITEVLSGEILSGNVSHAYLFCGSRGTGKTTCAKIFARAVNCEQTVTGDPCGTCRTCTLSENSFDIVEMDAASNNGVEEIRKLREEVLYPPTEMRKKVYIIDEVHMLSTSAFNALLKTLEEPPEHVVFILATTELNKIPVTILSRCKRFDFHRITPEKIFDRIKYISAEEGINISDEALRLISRLATGAMRDALSALEMFMGRDGKEVIDEVTAAQTLGVMGKKAVLDTVRAIAEKDIGKALEIVWQIYESGKDLGVLCSECGEIFRDMLMIKYVSEAQSGKLLRESAADIKELTAYSEMFTSDRLIYCTEVLEDTMQRLTRGTFSRRTLFETALFKLCGIAVSDIPESVSGKVSALEERLSSIERMIKSGTFVQGTQASHQQKSVSTDKASEVVGTQEVRGENVAVSGAVHDEIPVFSDEDVPPEAGDMPEDIPPFDIDGAVRKVPDKRESGYNPFDDVPFDAPKPLAVEKAEERPQAKVEVEVKQVVQEKSSADSGSGRKYVTNFNEIAGILHEKDRMYLSFLNNASAYYIGDDAIVVELSGFAYNFINNSESKKADISEAVERVLGRQVEVKLAEKSNASSSKGNSAWDL